MPGEQLLSIVDTYLPLERARFVKGSLKFARGGSPRPAPHVRGAVY